MGPWGALIGAVMGAVKHKEDMRAYQEEKKLASTTTRFSPWTGMKGDVSAAGPSAMKSIGGGAWSGFTGGLGGNMMGGGGEQAQGGSQIAGDSNMGPASQMHFQAPQQVGPGPVKAQNRYSNMA